MVTIKDIAKIAGVTIASVSRALNHEPGVSEQLRSKIISIAEEMNYVPNMAAKRLADKQSNCIGFIWPPGKGLFFNHLCNEFQTQGAKNGYSILVSFGTAEAAVRLLHEHFINRIVLWAGSQWRPSHDFLNMQALFQGDILIMGGGRMEEAHRVAVDRKEALYKAVEYLAELGHRRVAYVGLTSDDKLVGFTLGLLEFQLEYNTNHIIGNNPEHEFPEQQLIDILSADKATRPTAFIISNNRFLSPFLRVVRKLRLQCPDDFSLIVYDNIPEMGEIYDVPLTTIGPSINRLVAAATSIWSDNSQIDGKKVWKDITVESELNKRGSTIPIADMRS